MFWLVGAHRPTNFVELGTYGGFSYLAACQAVERHGTSTRCYAIDTWRGDEHGGFYGEEVLQALASHHDRRYSGFSTLIQGTFDESIGSFADGSIDLLHLDGRHYYDDVRHDFSSWLPKLSSRGIVLLHDTNVREQGFGVGRFFVESRDRYRSFEFGHGHGLGVIAVGKDIGEEVAALLALDHAAPEATVLRSVYARIGEAIELAWREGATSRENRANAAELLVRAEAIQRLESELAEQSVDRAELEKRFGDSERLAGNLARAAQPFFPGMSQVLAMRTLARSLRDRRLVVCSSLFDPIWYRTTYPDVARSGRDPALHYLTIGAHEGRDPGPAFSTVGYLVQNADVAGSGLNPLVHYIRHEMGKGRKAPPSRRAPVGAADTAKAAAPDQTAHLKKS
jgi:hypothetical protein